MKLNEKAGKHVETFMYLGVQDMKQVKMREKGSITWQREPKYEKHSATHESRTYDVAWMKHWYYHCGLTVDVIPRHRLQWHVCVHGGKSVIQFVRAS